MKVSKSILFIFLFLGLSWAQRAQGAQLQNLSFSSDEAGTRVTLEFSQPVEYTSNLLKNPDRFFIDLKKTVLGDLKGEYECGDPVQKIRLARFDNNTTRIVFDLATESSIRILKLDSPPRLMVLFKPLAPKDAPLAVSHKSPVNGHIESITNTAGEASQSKSGIAITGPINSVSASERRHKWRIVIDAGHGGHDPGAIGKRGLKEKNITLAVALEIAKALRKSPDFDVYLTRDSDIYLKLDERAAMANRLKADLFISVHVNASPHRSTRGIETYFLNHTNDEESNRVAARENDVSIERMKEAGNELGMILSSLELQGKREESMKLANLVQTSMVSSVIPSRKALNLGVKQALFYVLVGAEMPSVLAEISFISNAEEEKLLRNRNYIVQIANGISKGIKNYLKEVPAQDVAKK